MAGSPKNPNVERVSGMPFDKDSVSPMPQFAPRRRDEGASDDHDAANTPQPAHAAPPPDREEYPGPQTTTSGERVEPGRRSSSEGKETPSAEEPWPPRRP
jgi:hypothetical protein